MSFTFVDLFAGIGGFHAALSGMGGICVHAVEYDEKAASIYQLNWGINPLGDITDQANESKVTIPKHDVLVAGFPCQPFSKSGLQLGMEETRGTLYWNILQVIKKRRPTLVLLENVRNLAGPRHEHEWQIILKTLEDLSYTVSSVPTVISPHRLPPSHGGRPQVRERVFIVAVRVEGRRGRKLISEEPLISTSDWPEWDVNDWNLTKHLPLEKRPKEPGVKLTEQETHWINAWDDFVRVIREERDGKPLPGFPIWADHWVLPKNLQIPPKTPDWKIRILEKNATFYKQHKKTIDAWAKRWGVFTDAFPPSRRKLEWQAQDSKTLWETVMHLRPSGIRAKKATYLPALVAITQTSIIGKENRRISTREAARLQGLPDSFTFGNQNSKDTFRQLGNGVNVGAIWFVLRAAAKKYGTDLEKTNPQLLKALLNSNEMPTIDEAASTH